MKRIIKYGFYLGLALLPNGLKRFIFNKFLGSEIHHTAEIGLSFVMVKKIKMGPYAKIRHFNIIRNLEEISLAEYASIGNSNKIGALPLSTRKHFLDESDRYPALILGAHSSITGHHYFDCNNTISIGHHTIIAGLGSSFFTHGINIEENRQETEKIEIGDYCMVGAGSVVIKGARLPSYSILAANSTLHKAFDETYTLYSGVPAQAIKKLDTLCKYFHRDEGFVH